jgi:hypothetical protein
MCHRLVHLDHLVLRDETMRPLELWGLTPHDPSHSPVRALVRSFRRYGYNRAKPIRVQMTTTESGIGPVYLVLDGHLRVQALQWLQRFDYTAWRRICPAGQVPVRIASV